MVVGYLRVSTSSQTVDSQKLGVLEFAQREGLQVDRWHTVTMSGRKSREKREINTLISSLGAGDTLIVSELSRLGRSGVGDLTLTIDKLLEQGVTIFIVKEKMKLSKSEYDMTSKILVTMFGLMAQIESDLKSQRVKEGRARSDKKGGRPKGTRFTSLDYAREEIIDLYNMGVSVSKLHKKYKVSRDTIYRALKLWGVMA
jgi:DNA invertase Pin-like site-specific DNA recombinase